MAAKAATPGRVLAFLDTGVAKAWPELPGRLRGYAAAHGDVMQLAGRVQPVPGGELCKNDRDAVYRVLHEINEAGLDRQSFVFAIGGGAVLDCVGFAAAIAHRGVRLVRFPTTTLSQDDSGVGVKHGINGFGQKNFLGSFAAPWAVVNDERFLTTLCDRHWLAGFSEAVKVALLQDKHLFDSIEDGAAAIVQRDLDVAMPIVERSAILHLRHITEGGDPFETTTARPLDFGHWAAHRLEKMTDFALPHGEAVAIGLAIDIRYSQRVGLLPADVADRAIGLLAALRLPLWDDAMRDVDALLVGLEQFRQHLGGALTITLLRGVEQAVDVHEIDERVMREAVGSLEHGC